MVAVPQGISQPPNFFKESIMATKRNTEQQQPQHPATTERFDCYVVENYQAQGEDRANWIRVGVAFPQKDGKGFNLTLSAMPVDGRLVLRLHEPKPRED
jgi:hypothetical protein